MKDLQEYLRKIEEIILQGPYKDQWDSLSKHPVPQWFKKAKFGVFIHWGIYSVPAFGNDLYATVMRCSRNGQYRFQALGRKDASHEPNFAGIIENVSLLGFDSPCIWTRDESGLYVNVENVQSEYPIVFRIELA